MKRVCKECCVEKNIEEFVKGKGDLYRFLCKECRQKSRRTGRPNTGKFQKGQKSKGVTFKEGHTPWYILRGLPAPAKGKGTEESRFDSAKYKEWATKVKERDGYKCSKCDSTERLAAHHVKTWNECPELRFEISNGLTLCNVCHGREEGFKKGEVQVMGPEVRKKIADANRGRKVSEETRKKMREAKLGKPTWSKGKKFSEEYRKKLSDAKKGNPSNNKVNANTT